MMLIFESLLQAAPKADAWSAIAGLILLSTSLAFVLYFKTLHWNAVLGMGLFFTGLASMDGRVFRRKPRK